MEKRKRWQFVLICAVIFLTIYNILPTVFYYAKPLHRPIGESQATQIASNAAQRVNDLEKGSIDWLHSFCDLLKVKPAGIALDPKQPETISISFKSSQDAALFRKYLPRAGALIPFLPMQLSLVDGDETAVDKMVLVQRRIPVHFDQGQIGSFFQFTAKNDAQGNPTPLYRALINDRILEIGMAVGGPSQAAEAVQRIVSEPSDGVSQELLSMLCQDILSFTKTFGENSPLAKRYFASFTQTEQGGREERIKKLIHIVEEQRDKVRQEKNGAHDEQLILLTTRETLLSNTLSVLKNHSSDFSAGISPFTLTSIATLLEAGNTGKIQTIPLSNHNPFFEKLVIDWASDKIVLQPYADLKAAWETFDKENNKALKSQADQVLFNVVASLSRVSGEKISPHQAEFEINLSQLPNSKSLLAMRLGAIGAAEAANVKNSLLAHWSPTHPDLKRETFPIWDYETYQALPADQKKLGLVIYAPSKSGKSPLPGFRMNSIYVIARGLDKIVERAQAGQATPQAQLFMKDFDALRKIMQQRGFFGYPGSTLGVATNFSGDYIFEHEDYFQAILKASRENFTVHGTKRYAVLEFTDLEQRILALNKIETEMHEDLLKWRDDYRAAQFGVKGATPYDIPAPTKNVLLNNFALSWKKYFRGDERKVLHWGLDLSGGKSVNIELRDHTGKSVTSEEDIKQAIGELYTRVNKMGVSEVNIRQEGNFITLDFPGSQSLSASELVKASSMSFHVVNEQFGIFNKQLADVTNRFLQDVWNEAVVTGRKEAADVNLIAWKHLYGDASDNQSAQPRSEAAKLLFSQGLRLAHPEDHSVSSAFSETLSKLAVLRGNDYTDWEGQTHPLMVVFRNFALEGSNLENVRASYDPSKGNFLSFGVKGSGSAQDDFYSWTSQFSKEKVASTENGNYSRGKGWRMAVVLNDSVISSPTLDSPLRDSAMISGSFTQREINSLEADLKAGSLTFVPRILSEKNISPDLGSKERSLGIFATGLALVFVMITMVGYYKFGGFVATVAVLFNLLLMWATLQNLGAVLTLPGIAGIILTLGMAVDANVLVFERVREEFALSGRIASAMHAGYKKAFSAIVDSNLTTLIAALILLNFDSGPIKTFAVMLIIGILSSMFTSLFMTRFFFAGWVQNPEHKELKMASLIRASNFDFLKYTKKTMIISSVIILAGVAVFAASRSTILGMDFTGGYAVSVEVQAQPGVHVRQKVEQALLAKGAKAQDFQIRELTPANHVRIFFSRSMEQKGHPFYGLPFSYDLKEPTYAYENNPKIAWTISSLQSAGLKVAPHSLSQLDQSWTDVSGQMSSVMRNQAIIGLCLALLCILLYITFRFEFKYAISATLCLAHDVIFTVATLAILHQCGVPLQIDLNTIAALMTIIGYSLNDTIIVFDRIREDVRLMKKATFVEVINHALNATLSRTLMTSGTTLVVLIPLIILGGSTIFGFALVMAIGVIFGTLSSLFIAAPLMLFFHNRQPLPQLEHTQK
jgi:SecD/SecF fusion protein